MARSITEISEHDQLILMMTRYFKELGYTDIKADLSGWLKPESIYYTNDPNTKYIPDLTCFDTNGIYVILEAETCSTFNDQHTHNQFKIFRDHATNNHGRFEVVVPRVCSGREGRQSINNVANSWGINLDNVWTPSN